jgi:predicted PurR-regulated permease PerM
MLQLQKLVYGAILALIIGWVLYIGKNVFIPVAFGAVVVYIIVGLAYMLHRIPYGGRVLPIGLRQTLSVLVIVFALLMGIHRVMAYKESAMALAPQYQQSLLTAIQRVAVFFRIETEPTWSTLRQDLLAQINIQKLVGTMVASASSILVGIIVVLLYAVFLLVEQRSFETKIANISTDPQDVARVREIINDINRRVGSYLALKTFISMFLGVVSWAIMAFVGLEFAIFLAVLIGFLNYIPYIGSFLGIFFPVVLAIIQFNDPGMIITVLLSLTVAQFLIGNFLDPYVMGNSLNLSPFAILVSLAVWSELWGVPGAFLAVPITAIIAIVSSEFSGTRPIAVMLSQNGRAR